MGIVSALHAKAQALEKELKKFVAMDVEGMESSTQETLDMVTPYNSFHSFKPKKRTHFSFLREYIINSQQYPLTL
ncbi:MAG: hypothetical protein CVV29_08315 [Methanobacteriales archaeon HGW-Methanobacteriales-2]|nr:MAG: hypothetical protein CVV29_08315 [Methanobacteriales archaeon HGW-Methanobacteriales-2]